MRFYRQFIEPGSLCFDVGANVGARATTFMALGATVVAVEPQPACVAELSAISASDAALIIEPVALGRSEGTADLHIANESTISSLATGWIDRVRESGRFADYTWPEKIAVPVTTLDALIARYGIPDFTKIDVEGYEPEVIAGLSQPLPYLSVEFTAEWREAARDVVSRLDGLGMGRFNISHEESLRLAWDEWRTASDVNTYLDRLPADKLAWGDIYVAAGPA